jgi:hypothetical protein
VADAQVVPFKVPVRGWRVDAFPTAPSANGSMVQRAKLRAMVVERMAQAGAGD